MASRTQDWIVAASCCEGPRPCVTFADMPPEHRRDMFLVAFAAALTSAYIVTLGILMQPIPSRSLAAPILMPNPSISLAALRDTTPFVAAEPTRRRPAHDRTLRPLAAVRLASMLEAPAGNNRIRTVASARERRPNFLGRFFRGVLRSVQPAGPKADVP